MAKLTDEEIVEIEMIANYPFIEKIESANGNIFTGVLSVCVSIFLYNLGYTLTNILSNSLNVSIQCLLS